MPSEPEQPRRPGAFRCTRSLSGSRAPSIATRRRASVWMTATSMARRKSAMRGENGAALVQQRPGAQREIAQAFAQRRRALAAPRSSTAARLAAKRIERHIDAIEVAVVGAAILQVIDDLQRRAQRVVGGPDRAILAMHVATRSARPAWPSSCNSSSGRPSRGSAAWSHPSGTPSRGRGHGAARGCARAGRCAAAPASGTSIVLAQQAGLELVQERELLGSASVAWSAMSSAVRTNS